MNKFKCAINDLRNRYEKCRYSIYMVRQVFADEQIVKMDVFNIIVLGFLFEFRFVLLGPA